MSDEACCNCGNPIPKFPECPVRMKEVTVARIRPIQQVSYVEAVKIAEGVRRGEGSGCPTVCSEAMQEKDPNKQMVNKVDFVVFIERICSSTNNKAVIPPLFW